MKQSGTRTFRSTPAAMLLLALVVDAALADPGPTAETHAREVDAVAELLHRMS